jgi:hypothetical protein
VKNLRKSRSKNPSVGQLEESDLLVKVVNGVETWMIQEEDTVKTVISGTG